MSIRHPKANSQKYGGQASKMHEKPTCLSMIDFPVAKLSIIKIAFW